MPLPPLRPLGLNPQSMPKDFAAPPVGLARWQPNGLGLIGDRPFLWKTIAVSGRNFTNANAAVFGGPGAMSVPHPP